MVDKILCRGKEKHLMNSFLGRSDKSLRTNLFKIFLVSILVFAVLKLVYFTGGTKKVYVHLMYIPITLSSLFWGSYIGFTIGMICGILTGPLVPLDVSQGVMQDSMNWISRALIFSLLGFLIGYLFDKIIKLNNEKEERNLKSPFFDLPNAQKLLYDIESKIKSGERFRLLSIKLTNLHEIEKYIDNELVYDIVNNLAKKLMNYCGQETVYSYEKDELIVLICENCENCENNYVEKIKNMLENYFTNPISLHGYKIRVSLKVGIYEYDGEEKSPIEIYNKARIAYEQGEAKESGIYYYDVSLECKRRQNHNITGALLESIIKNELYVVYQPKIDIVNNKISGVEALVRWKINGKDFVGPNTFIPIAEEIGFINKIAKFVCDTVTTQIEEWKIKGIDIKCSINISVHELLDDNHTSWINGIIASKNIDRSKLEIEITERALAYNDKRLLDKMNYLKEKGFQISIDDFGTGYNSLMSAGEIPYDKLKIDKYFISMINRIEIAEMVKHIIEYAHTFGKIVVAEGVETEEQLNTLKKLSCDEIQGYYFSKPLLPEEFEKFYLEFSR